MSTAGAIAFMPADVAFGSSPPGPPWRPQRRSKGQAGRARSLIRAVRRELWRGTANRPEGALPRPSRR
jgi:hypothetical protein